MSRRDLIDKEFVGSMNQVANEYAEGFRKRSQEAAEAPGEIIGQRKDCINPESCGCEDGVFRNSVNNVRNCNIYKALPLSRSLCPVRKAGWSYTVSQTGIPLKYQDTTTQSLNPEWYPEHLRPSMRLVERYIRYLEEHIRKGGGLVLNGDHKAMRTSMAVHILMEAIAKGKSGFFIASSSLIDRLYTLRTASKKDIEESINFERRLKQTDLLVWDDLGLEHSEDWVETKALSIISERYNNAKPTIFTTCLDLDELPRNSIAYHVMEVTREANTVIGFELAAPQPDTDQMDHKEDVAAYLSGDMASDIEKCDHDWALVVGLGEGPGWKYCKKCNVHGYVPEMSPMEKIREGLRDKGLAEKLAFTDGFGEGSKHYEVTPETFEECKLQKMILILAPPFEPKLPPKHHWSGWENKGLTGRYGKYQHQMCSRCGKLRPYPESQFKRCRLIYPVLNRATGEAKAEPKHHWGKVQPGQDQMCTWCSKTRPGREEKLEVWKKEDIEADQARLKKVIEQTAPEVHPQVEVKSTDGFAPSSENPGFKCELSPRALPRGHYGQHPFGRKVKPKHDWFESPDENKEICTQCGKTRASPLSAWAFLDRQIKRCEARLYLCTAAEQYPRVEGWVDEDMEM